VSATTAIERADDDADPVLHSAPARLRLFVEPRPSPDKTEQQLHSSKNSFWI
jgi:hypothetical protein